MSFQAETRQLLNIVTNSLYTDRHVFLRELISNASDALEKARLHAASGGTLSAGGLSATPLAITVTTDAATRTLTVEDSGIGMSREELIDNLGTIARSGSRAFLARLREEGGGGGASPVPAAGSDDAGAGSAGSRIIGQFGVGFYSVFMVCDSVTVISRGAEPGAPAWRWTSSGDGDFEVSPVAEGDAAPARGTRVTLALKESAREFAGAAVKDVIVRYSSFLAFPIHLNGKLVNTVGAIWARSKADVTEAQYTEFYKFKSGDFEPPLYRLHFASDAPLALSALLFAGSTHEEKYGMGRVKPGVDLYSRRVLIQAGAPVLPDWLRFLHGVVDSEDVPLNIAREGMQDSALLRRLRAVLTRRVLRFLESEARRDPAVYARRFFSEFGTFLKEGAVSDASYAPEIARLLRFESSALPPGEMTSFDEYISRSPTGQTAIYYLVAPHRGLAEASPYMEAFRSASAAGGAPTEVLFLYAPLDDFVMNNLREFNGRKLVTAEMADLDPTKLAGEGGASAAQAPAVASTDGDASTTAAAAPSALTAEQVAELGEWLRTTLPGRVSKVRATTRLRSSPAVVTDHESAAVRRMMRLVEQSSGSRQDSEAVRQEAHMLPAQTLEVNAAHPVIVRLHALRNAAPAAAALIAEQVLDNALVAAGLVDDARVMLPRLNALLEMAIEAHGPAGASAGTGAGGDSAAAAAYRATAAATATRRHTSDKESSERASLAAMRAAVDESVTDPSAADGGEAATGARATVRAPKEGAPGDDGGVSTASAEASETPDTGVEEIDSLLNELAASAGSKAADGSARGAPASAGGRGRRKH